MKTLVLLSGTLALTALPALAQVPTPTASFTGESVMTTPEGTIASRVYGMPGKMRTDSYISGMSTVNVMDFNKEEVLSWSPDPNSGMGTMAMRMNYGDVSRKYGYDPKPDADARLTGSDTVAGHSCNTYESQGMTACVTYDGIVLRARSPEGYGTEMTTLQRGPQSSTLFTIPAGYTVMDPTNFGSMLGSISSGNNGGSPYQSSSGASGYNEYWTQSQPRNEPQAQSQSEENFGDVIGNAVGGDAGKVIGGLFGKKKKKKKKRN